jgi:hypothetical protein
MKIRPRFRTSETSAPGNNEMWKSGEALIMRADAATNSVFSRRFCPTIPRRGNRIAATEV